MGAPDSERRARCIITGDIRHSGLERSFIFMTVPKSRRKKSRFEVFHNMAVLQKNLVMDLMVDFGITRTTKLGSYDKLLSYKTECNMKALYNQLFAATKK